MATVVDSLIVELGLDPSGFTKGQKEAASSFLKTRDAAQKTGKDIEEAGKRAAEFFSALRREVIGLFAAFTAGRGLKEFIADITAADAALGRMAQNLNTAPQTLSAWGQAVERVGGNAQSAAGSFQSLSNSFNELRTTGNTGILPWLYRLQAAGGTAFNFAKPLDEQLVDISKNLSAIARTDPALANFFGRQLGLDQGTINFLLRGPDAVRRMVQEQRQFAPKKEDIEAAEKLQDAWVQLRFAADSLGRALVTGLNPFLVDLLKWLKDVVVAIRDNVVPEIKKFAKEADAWIKQTLGIEHGFEKLAGVLLLIATIRIPQLIASLIGLMSGAALRGLVALLALNPATAGIAAFVGGLMPSPAGEGENEFQRQENLKRDPDYYKPGHPGYRGGGTGSQSSSSPSGGGERGAARPGIGARAARGALAANQKEAYRAAREEGLSDTAARALVANMSGESLANPRDHHWDRTHMSQGIVQWDPQRAEAIKRQFGKYPKDMTVAEQTRAAIWEIRNNPRFRRTRDALHGGGSAEGMIDALVRNYEVPLDKEGAIATRRRFYNGLGNIDRSSASGDQSSLPYFARAGLGAPGVASISNDNRSNSYTSSSSTRVGAVNVYMPSGANAVDVAKDIGPAIERNAFTAHANYGPN